VASGSAAVASASVSPSKRPSEGEADAVATLLAPMSNLLLVQAALGSMAIEASHISSKDPIVGMEEQAVSLMQGAMLGEPEAAAKLPALLQAIVRRQSADSPSMAISHVAVRQLAARVGRQGTTEIDKEDGIGTFDSDSCLLPLLLAIAERKDRSDRDSGDEGAKAEALASVPTDDKKPVSNDAASSSETLGDDTAKALIASFETISSWCDPGKDLSHSLELRPFSRRSRALPGSIM